MAIVNMPVSPISLSRGISVDSTTITGNGSPRRRNMRSSSPSADRFNSVTTPTFDNRRRRSITPNKKQSPKKRREKAPTGRKTKIQVCIRVRPILPSDFKRIPPTPEEKMHKSSPGRHSHVKVKVNRTASKRLNRSESRLSTLAASAGDSQEIIDTEPAWEMVNNTVEQAAHTNPELNRNNKYTFDHTFGPENNTSQIYQDTVRESVISTMEGYHASVFAYGQTATGKTFTMTGGGKNIETKEGIVQLAIKDCFDYIQGQKDETREYLLRVSFMEIYNEVINDLLASPNRSQPIMTGSSRMVDSNTPPPSAIRIFESKNEGVVVRGLKEEIVTCPDQVFSLLAAGERRRQTGSTSMNKHSSRSHSIFRLIVESRKRIPRQTSSKSYGSDTSSVADSIASSTFAPASTAGPVRVSSLSLVDLAGSESVKNTGSTGTRQKEGQYINKSLLTLGHVVYKLADAGAKSDKGGKIDTMHIPYRDSKLTRLLQPSLSGNAQICIICNISPLSKHIEESHLTLKFASRAKKIKQHATINEVLDEKTLLENYREEIEDLKNQLKEAKEAQENLNVNGSDDDNVKGSSSIDEDDVDVLTQAVSNLENLILKTTTAEEKKRKQKRREALKRMRQEKGIPTSITGDTEDNDRDGDNLLNGVLGATHDDSTLLNSLSLDEYPGSKGAVYRGGTSSISLLKDDHKDDHSLASLGSGSIGDDSTLLEGRKLATELTRIQKLLGTVLEKKGSVGTPNRTNSSNRATMLTSNLSNPAQSQIEVERLRAQLHEQAVHTSLRKADSTFLQSQLQEKNVLLQEISQILETVTKRQEELDDENARLKLEWTRAVDALREKEAESEDLRDMIKTREDEMWKLKEKAGGE